MTEKVTMTAEDTETTINYSKFLFGDFAELYTTDKAVMKRVENFCNKHPEYGRLVKEDKYSMTFLLHIKCASIYPKAPRKCNYTEEQRQALRDRLKAYRST